MADIPEGKELTWVSAAVSSAAFWETPGAAHIDLAYAGRAAYQKLLPGFLESTLRARDGPRDVWPMSVV